MHMTLHTDYALRMLIYIGTRRDENCTVNEVASAYTLSHNHLLKVALTLRRAGFIETMRGRLGGIRLAMTPDLINIGSVVRTIEDDFELVECLGNGHCAISPVCRLKGIFADALQAYLSVLDKYTLQDVVRNRRGLATYLGIELKAA